MIQRTLADALTELLELQIAQNVITLEVAHKRQLLQNWHNSLERSLHNRNFALAYKKRYETEANEAEKKFDANQKHLKELRDEVVALISAPH